MDESFYKILTKHFLGQASPDEELRVAAFKSENRLEYEALKKFFDGKEASVRDLDSKAAWEKVLQKYTLQHDGKTVPLYRVWWRVAASVALLILCWFVIDNYRGSNAPPMLEALGSQRDSVVLHDGSVVWLNDGARIEYPPHFSKTREVVLIGEAFFDVVRDPARPFTVVTGDTRVRVLGTSFNVRAAGNLTEVSVASGSVEVSEVRSGKKLVLEPGFTARVSGKKVESFVTTDLNYNSWATGAFYFNDTPLSRVISDLNEYYGQQLHIEGSDINCALTAKFDREQLAEIVEVLELTCGISAVRTADGFVLTRGSER